ncbi:MAG: TIGR02266 family protein [Pedobacter sp.]
MWPQNAKTTILLADGASTILEVEKNFFRRERYDILLANSAQEVYETAITHHPDIIFMGLQMQEMCGDELCLRFKAHAELCHVPVVLVVQPHRPDDFLRCQRSGCDDILLKPPRRHHFLRAVEKHLKVPRRAAPRVEAKMHVTYREPSGEHALTHFSINISTGGLFIETETPLPVGTPLLLDFTLPGHHDIVRCKGRVAWVNHADGPKHLRLPPGMGLQFFDLTLEDMALVRSYIMRSLVVPDW